VNLITAGYKEVEGKPVGKVVPDHVRYLSGKNFPIRKLLF